MTSEQKFPLESYFLAQSYSIFLSFFLVSFIWSISCVQFTQSKTLWSRESYCWSLTDKGMETRSMAPHGPSLDHVEWRSCAKGCRAVVHKGRELWCESENQQLTCLLSLPTVWARLVTSVNVWRFTWSSNNFSKDKACFVN